MDNFKTIDRLINSVLSMFILLTLTNCQSQNNSPKTLYKSPKEVFILDSVTLKNKYNTFKIATFEKNSLKNKENVQHNSNTIVVLIKENGKLYNYKLNNKLVFAYDDNCPADGYGRIAGKNNFFTVEQSFCVDFWLVYSYATFKIDDNGVINLHKYGEEYSDRSNPDNKIPTKIWTKKDFGDVKFEEISESYLTKLRLTKPKK